MAEQMVVSPKSVALTLVRDIEEHINELCALAAAGEAYVLRMNNDGESSTEFRLFKMLVDKAGDMGDVHELRRALEALPSEAHHG